MQQLFFVGGYHALAAQTDEDPLHALFHQGSGGPFRVLLPGEFFRLQGVGLYGGEPVEHRQQLHRLGGGYRVGIHRDAAVFAYVADGLLREIGIHHYSPRL